MAQGETPITIVGNMVADPELKYTQSGAAVANFRVASTPRFYNRETNQWEDGQGLFLSCNVWREAAENVVETLSKGMRVIVTGRLRQRNYETREGERRTVFEIEVDEVGPSLKFASAQVNRNQRSGGSNYGNQGGNRRPQQNTQQNQGFGSNSAVEDPWSSAPPAGGGFGGDDEPPF